eukprot:jgi/Mesvir1/3488/Mv11979-RA.1
MASWKCLLLGLAVLSLALPLHAEDDAQVASDGDLTLGDEKGLWTAFRTWADQHSKAYKTFEEERRRFLVFKDNLAFILEHNSKDKNYKLGLNPYADLTHDEFKSFALGYRAEDAPMVSSSGPFTHANVSPPDEIDWRTKDAVTPVKNQLQCGSCWAFSTTGSVEGVWAIHTGKLVPVSEQELVDCDVTKDQGCRGGLMDFAFAFIIKNGGITTEEDYPYTAKQDQCDMAKERHHRVKISGFVDVPSNDEDALKRAVSQQPVSVAIEADKRAFQFYSSGVFDDDCGEQLDHGVLVVGYGTDENGTDYWIVKNSWGALWGDEGYIKLSRGNHGPAGQCGIAMKPSYPTMGGGPGPSPGPTPGPSPPGPQRCDATHECPALTTCCCAGEVSGACVQWGCCPLPEASCCEDHIHCCPSSLPVCDIAQGRCTKGDGGDEFVALLTKQPATKVHEDLLSRVRAAVRKFGGHNLVNEA